MPSFDPATAPSSSYPPPTTVSSDSRSSHSVTPQASAVHQQQPHGAPPPPSAYMGYHPGMGHNMYPPPGSAIGSAGDKQSQPQQYSAWHAYPPFPAAFHGGPPPGFAYAADGNALMQQTQHQQQQQQHQQQQQQGYPHGSYPQQRLRASPPPKRDSPDKPTEVLSSNTTSSPTTSSHRSSSASGGEQKEPELADQVNPIKTDFHFFVKDILPELRDAAAAEVDESLQGKSEDFIAMHRQYLLNSNLNCRVMKMWEDVEQERREDYFQKEETDRKRFMEEDEVASRHCFTLTARQRSPIEGEGTANGTKRPSSTNPGDEETPHKKANMLGTETFFAPVVGDM